ncbi:uncharacterized protein LOC107633574 isoform X1 [Arachis ipaensis]|uniref:uncharacterized protein LOC107633574 isoform X1 n=1 Tax=Arachis ipaensis TaxID=130454 RepID=UPI0007AF4FA4|nr:uncharacterized protein LOC107633574 isoform X1 [Arachis ipaensis]XP_025629254.1 uncharacterized protein LOC112722452 isoform X1 [Arachis hypogaea]
MRLGCRHRRREGESRRNPSPCTPSPKSIEWGRRNRGLPPSLEMAVGLRKPRHTPVAAGNVIDALGVSHWSCDCSVLGFFCAHVKKKLRSLAREMDALSARETRSLKKKRSLRYMLRRDCNGARRLCLKIKLMKR